MVLFEAGAALVSFAVCFVLAVVVVVIAHRDLGEVPFGEGNFEDLDDPDRDHTREREAIPPIPFRSWSTATTLELEQPLRVIWVQRRFPGVEIKNGDPSYAVIGHLSSCSKWTTDWTEAASCLIREPAAAAGIGFSGEGGSSLKLGARIPVHHSLTLVVGSDILPMHILTLSKLQNKNNPNAVIDRNFLYTGDHILFLSGNDEKSILSPVLPEETGENTEESKQPEDENQASLQLELQWTEYLKLSPQAKRGGWMLCPYDWNPAQFLFHMKQWQ